MIKILHRVEVIRRGRDLSIVFGRRFFSVLIEVSIQGIIKDTKVITSSDASTMNEIKMKLELTNCKEMLRRINRLKIQTIVHKKIEKGCSVLLE